MSAKPAARTSAGAVALALLSAALDCALLYRLRGWQLDLTSSLLLLAALFATTLFVVEVGLTLCRASPAMRGNLRTLVVASTAALLCSELYLRYGLRTYATYLEKVEGGGYHRAYEGRLPSWFHLYSPNIEFTHQRSEFAFPRKTNSLGLCERELPEQKPTGEYRVIALGDSYTEGVGTAYEETWIKTVEERLRPPFGLTVQAFNAGISGSDPWYEYVLLKEKLVRFRPDLVLVAINPTDIVDVITRGGRERFQPDGSTVGPRPPVWERLYGVSYLYRHVVHDVFDYDNLFVRKQERGQVENNAAEQLLAAARAFAELARERDFEVVIVVHPTAREAARRQYGGAFARLAERLKHAPGLKVVDVLDVWIRGGRLARERPRDLYWPVDGHNNSRGYAAFGEAVVEGLVGLKLTSES